MAAKEYALFAVVGVLLFLISEAFNETENPHDYYFGENPSILSIEVFGNPYFYPTYYPFMGIWRE